ncbi:MAG: hypothetical protein ACYC5H_13090 [Methylovirgula sp.]
MRYIVIGGVRYEWKEILRLRREQIRATRKQQLALFEMKDDRRPPSQKTADGRFTEPTLFKVD